MPPRPAADAKLRVWTDGAWRLSTESRQAAEGVGSRLDRMFHSFPFRTPPPPLSPLRRRPTHHTLAPHATACASASASDRPSQKRSHSSGGSLLDLFQSGVGVPALSVGSVDQQRQSSQVRAPTSPSGSCSSRGAYGDIPPAVSTRTSTEAAARSPCGWWLMRGARWIPYQQGSDWHRRRLSTRRSTRGAPDATGSAASP